LTLGSNRNWEEHGSLTVVTRTWSLKYRSHATGFFDFIQDVSSFAACDEDATPNDLSPATPIHPLVAEMPLEDLKLKI